MTAEESVDQTARDLAREALNRVSGHERECALRYEQSHKAQMDTQAMVSELRGFAIKFGVTSIGLLGASVVTLLVYIWHQQAAGPWGAG